jgi:hypothetical protein
MNTQHASVMVEGKPVRGVIATCKCGVTTPIPVNTILGSPADQDRLRDAFVAKKLEAKGWKVLKEKDGHRCPGCVTREDAGRRAAAIRAPVVVKDFKEMPIKNAHFAGPSLVHASDEPPQELTRENRRIILAKLEDIYVDERTGYSPGWTDAKVANDLGVPRAWVKTLRADNFGPEGNEDIRLALSEAKAMLTEITISLKQAETFASAFAGLQRRAEKIERTVIEIEKGLRA